MITILLALFRNSLPLQLFTGALLLWGAWSANNVYQRHVGASRLAAQIETKANEQVQTSQDVRTDVASGKRGMRDPSKRQGN